MRSNSLSFIIAIRLRRAAPFSAESFILTVIAGTGEGGFGGDGGKALEAELNTPQKIAVAKDGSLFIADRANHRVRKVDTQGAIINIAGAGQGAGIMFDPTIK